MVSQLGELLKSSSPSNPLRRRRSWSCSPANRSKVATVPALQMDQPQAVFPDRQADLQRLPDRRTPVQAQVRPPASTSARHLWPAPIHRRYFTGSPEPLAVVNSQVFYPTTGRPPNSNAATDKFLALDGRWASHELAVPVPTTVTRRGAIRCKRDVQARGSPAMATADVRGHPAVGHFYCSPSQPEINLYMFEKKLYADLDRWIETGTPPPTAPDPVIVNGHYVLDANGNMEGGLRMPEMQVPIATYSATIEHFPQLQRCRRPVGVRPAPVHVPGTRRLRQEVRRCRRGAGTKRIPIPVRRRRVDGRRRGRPRFPGSRPRSLQGCPAGPKPRPLLYLACVTRGLAAIGGQAPRSSGLSPRAKVTDHSLPVLEATHIHPWAVGGTHSIPNGVPLRRDLHRLFDLGYVTIRSDMRFSVSRRLRDDYANGRAYYELDERELRLPDREDLRPDPAVLSWHGAEVFLEQ